MMNNRVMYTYINIYFNNMKNINAVDKSLYAVIAGMITYTVYMKLQKHVYFRREDPAHLFALPILPNLPTSQIS
jgi:hypothetical protein